MIQSAETPVFEALRAKPETFLIYDVCDRYFESAKTFKTPTGEVDSLSRFNELMDRANFVIAPTVELKAELALRFPAKPVSCVPEMIDYSRGFLETTPADPRRVLWFGSPQRGNFESARWVLDELVQQHGYELRIVSRRRHFAKMPKYAAAVGEWDIDSFVGELSNASLCVVTHSEEEQSKSPNRFVTAVAHGIPTLVSNSSSCAALLRQAGCDYAIVSTPDELEQAVRRLEDPAERRSYVQKVQVVLEAEHGDRAVRDAYLHLLLDRVYDTKPARRRRVAFVTHNLNFGEGAPKSLFEVAVGLRDTTGVEPFVYCTVRGDLEAFYQKADIPVVTFSDGARPPMTVLNKKFEEVRLHFQAFLEENQIDYVVANTIKSAPFSTFAHEIGIPSSIIIRESFDKQRRFDYYMPAAHEAAERGLLTAECVVFVSNNTSLFWSDQPMTPDLRLIKNGVSPAPFAAALDLDQVEARMRLGLTNEDLIAVCVGTINDRKGQGEIAQWYAQLPPEIRDRLTILFVGATENHGLTTFRSQYDVLPEEVRSKLRVISTTPDIGIYYRASNFFLMNSSQESYPRSVMEALLFGLPVVSTPVFGVLEQIVDGETGFIFPYHDMAAWHGVIARLVLDEDLRRELSAAAARSFWKMTTYAEMIHDYRCVVAAPGRV